MLSSYDGLYKNSFVFFRKSDAPYLFLESNPKIVSFSSGEFLFTGIAFCH